YVSQDFFDARGGRQIMSEGFTEVLGDQLYDHIAGKAAHDQKLRDKLQAGLSPGACIGEPIPSSTLQYGGAAESAEKIREVVGDAGFRAAYFLGRMDLVGIH